MSVTADAALYAGFTRRLRTVDAESDEAGTDAYRVDLVQAFTASVASVSGCRLLTFRSRVGQQY